MRLRLALAALLLPTAPAARAQVVPPLASERAAPETPTGPSAAVAGRVVLSVRVTETGDVDSVRVATALEPDLDRLAIAAVRRWRYTPATDAGRPVAMWTQAAIRFEPVAPRVLVPGFANHADDTNEMFGARVRVDSSLCRTFVPPQPTQIVEPDYTSIRERRGRRPQGRVLLRVAIGADGRPAEVRVVESAHPALDRAASAAVAKWRFSAPLCDGEPIGLFVTLPIRFRQEFY